MQTYLFNLSEKARKLKQDHSFKTRHIRHFIQYPERQTQNFNNIHTRKNKRKTNAHRK